MPKSHLTWTVYWYVLVVCEILLNIIGLLIQRVVSWLHVTTKENIMGACLGSWFDYPKAIMGTCPIQIEPVIETLWESCRLEDDVGAENPYCNLSSLLRNHIVTCHCCWESILSPVIVAENQYCHLSSLLRIHIVTFHRSWEAIYHLSSELKSRYHLSSD